MSHVDWSVKGLEVTSCNCDWGCPCQFNALPSHGDCRAAVGMHIDEGHFGEVRLNGLRWVALFAWPGAVHEGNGEAQIIIDANADEAQRDALLKILTGQETEPGATVFNVFSSTKTTVYDPMFKTIEFEGDLDSRRGRFVVEGVVETTTSPITNPITGDAHRVRVVLPHGFEYTNAEYASGAVQSSHASIALDWSTGHAHLAVLHLGPYGQLG